MVRLARRRLENSLAAAHELLLRDQIDMFRAQIPSTVHVNTILDHAFFDDYFADRAAVVQHAMLAAEEYNMFQENDVVGEGDQVVSWLEHARIAPAPGISLENLLDIGITKRWLYAGLREVAEAHQAELRRAEIFVDAE